MVRSHFLNSLPIVAAEIGSRFGVTVLVGGKYAYTDGEQIRLPDPGPNFAELELLGYLAHEAAHVRFSSFRELEHVESAFERDLTNALEDVRIESEMGKIYGGVRGLIDSALGPVLDQHVERLQEGGKVNPGSLIGLYLLAAGEVKMNQSPVFSECMDHAGRKLADLFGAEFVTKLNGVADKMPLMRSTSDAHALALEVIRIVGDLMKDAPKMPLPRKGMPQAGGASEGQPSGSGEGQSQESGDGNSSGNSSGGSSGVLLSEDGPSDSQNASSNGTAREGESKDGSSGKDAGRASDGQDSSGETGTSGSSSSGNAGESSSQSSSVSQGSGSSGSADASDNSDAQGQEDDGAQSSAGAGSTSGGGRRKGSGAGSKKLKDAAAKIRRAAKQALGMKEKDREDSFDFSRAIRKKLEDAASQQGQEPLGAIPNPIEFFTPGDDTVRTGKSVGQSLTKKMALERGQIRYELAQTLAGSLQRSLMGFVQSESRRKAWSADRGQRLSNANLPRVVCGSSRIFERRVETRAVDTAVHVLLDLSGSMHQRQSSCIASALGIVMALMRIPHVNPALSALCRNAFQPVILHGTRNLEASKIALGGLSAYGGTPLATAIGKAAYALKRARTHRHVLIVLSDGVPDNNQTAAARVLIRELEKSGVDVIGIGIEHCPAEANEMKNYFRNFIEATKAEQLPEKLFECARIFLGRDIARDRQAA